MELSQIIELGSNGKLDKTHHWEYPEVTNFDNMSIEELKSLSKELVDYVEANSYVRFNVKRDIDFISKFVKAGIDSPIMNLCLGSIPKIGVLLDALESFEQLKTNVNVSNVSLYDKRNWPKLVRFTYKGKEFLCNTLDEIYKYSTEYSLSRSRIKIA